MNKKAVDEMLKVMAAFYILENYEAIAGLLVCCVMQGGAGGEIVLNGSHDFIVTLKNGSALEGNLCDEDSVTVVLSALLFSIEK